MTFNTQPVNNVTYDIITRQYNWFWLISSMTTSSSHSNTRQVIIVKSTVRHCAKYKNNIIQRPKCIICRCICNQKTLTRGRTDQFISKNSTANQLEQQRSVHGTPPPRHTEIGTVSLPPVFPPTRRNWFSHLSLFNQSTASTAERGTFSSCHRRL